MKMWFLSANDLAECQLCPHFCKLKPGQAGICGVRKNKGKLIELMTYGVISGKASDPIEKKPLYHYFPGSHILSIGSYGCNMKCDFCQNFHIAHSLPESKDRKMMPDELAIEALNIENNIGIAFTYNEPVIWFEFIRDVAEAVKKIGKQTVMVSNGYVNSEPLSEITGFIDAFNIDLKAFNSTFYKKLTGADINPVKNALKQIARSGKHLEITTLVIPGENDSEKEMDQQADWIAGELGKNVPLHLSRYFPNYRRDNPPTSDETLLRLYEIASEKLDYVYIGNTLSEKGQNTYCPECGVCVSIRSGYSIKMLNLDTEGKCTGCGKMIYSNFTISSSKAH